MKRISLWLLVFTFAVCVARAQDAATQQQIDKLNGQIQDLSATVDRQNQEIADLTKQISELSDKVNTPAANNSASADDLKALAAQVQEIDKKRQDDRDLILKQIEQLGKVSGATPSHRSSSSPKPTTDGTDNTGPAVPQKGYDYIVKDGDYLSTIAKAYRDKGVKVTTAEILKANPGLDPTKLYVGKKIFIPDANAK
jgi:septal ring factor EnvC (AmiA/AmiB activator)